MNLYPVGTTTGTGVAGVAYIHIDATFVSGRQEAAYWRALGRVVEEHGGILLHHLACAHPEQMSESVRCAMFSRLSAHIRLMDETMTDDQARAFACYLLAEEAEDEP